MIARRLLRCAIEVFGVFRTDPESDSVWMRLHVEMGSEWLQFGVNVSDDIGETAEVMIISLILSNNDHPLHMHEKVT